MKIDSAQYIGGQLVLKTSDSEAIKFAYNFKPGEYRVTKAKKARSLDANAYCWALCTEIARAVRMEKEDVYRRNIREAGEYTPLPIKEQAVDEFKRIWAGHGIGWFVDVIDDSKIPGYKLCFAYQGSSVYDTAQMARLIDNLTQDAKAVGVSVISDREKSLLLEGWDEKQTHKGA